MLEPQLSFTDYTNRAGSMNPFVQFRSGKKLDKEDRIAKAADIIKNL